MGGYPATSVVISEFRFIGDGAGNDEFVELYNPTGNPIDITGWLIRGSNNVGTVSTRATIPSVILQPGQYYLVAHTGYSGPVAADLTYGTGITTDGGVALTLADTTTIIDQVGLSTGSFYKEGNPQVSLTTNVDRSYERYIGGVNGNCQDDGDNFLDFVLLNPSNPQNASSAAVLCGAPTPTPTPTSTPTITATSTITSTATITSTITATSTITTTPTITPTTTVTSTPTTTGTPTKTPTKTVTSTLASTGPFSVLINEVAWAGTSSSRSADEWIELFNTTSTEINLNGWELRKFNGSIETVIVTFDVNDKIPGGGFFILAHASSNGDYDIFNDVDENKSFTDSLSNTGPIALQLYDSFGNKIDTANSGKALGWYAGNASTYSSMERRGKNYFDGTSAWFTFGGTPFAHNRNGVLVRGTPKRSNWAIAVTPTRVPVRTATRTPIPTNTPIPTYIPPDPRPIINEILPRPGFDWNKDGKVDVFDEFVEIKNLTSIDINLKGWKLDDELDFGSNPFTLPDVTLKPGQRVIFFALDTNILLSDGGDTVRLISPNGKIYDAYTYSIAKAEDQSICRLPDGNVFGGWFEDCIPTPNLTNTREGAAPTIPDAGYESPVCKLPDTLPADFLFAECHGYGADIWDADFWDQPKSSAARYLPQNTSKWEAIIE